VFVRVEGMPLTVFGITQFDEFVVSDGNTDTYVDNYIYNLPVDGAVDFPNFGLDATFTAIQGPVNFSFDNFKIAPRFPSDLEGYMEAPPPPWITINDLTPGDLVITEVMYNPNVCNDANCEWIEVYNASGSEVDLQGLRVQDSLLMATGTVTIQLLVPDGGYVWLGKGPAMNWTYSAQPDAYTGSTNPAFNNNGQDRAVVLNDNEIIDQTALYTAVPEGTGASWQLHAGSNDSVANDDPANWCYATMNFGDGDRGTPTLVNEACF